MSVALLTYMGWGIVILIGYVKEFLLSFVPSQNPEKNREVFVVFNQKTCLPNLAWHFIFRVMLHFIPHLNLSTRGTSIVPFVIVGIDQFALYQELNLCLKIVRLMIMAGHSGINNHNLCGIQEFIYSLSLKIASPTPLLNVLTWDLTITWVSLNVKDRVPLQLKKLHTAWEWESAVPDKSLVHCFKRNICSHKTAFNMFIITILQALWLFTRNWKRWLQDL